MAELDDLRAAFAAGTTAVGEHLDELTWERLACGELDEAARQAALEHLLSCRECADVGRVVMAIRSGAAAFDPAAPGATAHHATDNLRWLRRGVLPALLTAAAAIVLVVVIRPQLGRTPVTGTPPGPVLRAARVAAVPQPVAPVGSVAAPPAAFEWRPVEEPASYVVELLDSSGATLWTSTEITATQAPWPHGLELPAGTLYWRVTARPEAGGQPVTSSLAAFDLAGPLSASPR